MFRKDLTRVREISYHFNSRGFGIRGFGIRGFGIRGFGKGKSFCMRKFIMSVVVALVVLFGTSFYVYKTNDVIETYENKENKEVNNNMLSMMLETSVGSGNYQATTRSDWPKENEGYGFNKNLSKCERGGSVIFDVDNRNVVLKHNGSDKCYVYFDKVELKCVKNITLSKPYDGTPISFTNYPVENLFQYTISDNSPVYKIQVEDGTVYEPIIYKEGANQTISTIGSQKEVGKSSAGSVILTFENGLSCTIGLELTVTTPKPIIPSGPDMP